MEELPMERAMQALEAGGNAVTSLLLLSVGAFCREPGLFYSRRYSEFTLYKFGG